MHVVSVGPATAFKDAHLALKRELMALSNFRDFGVGRAWNLDIGKLEMSDDALLALLAQIRRLCVAYDNGPPVHAPRTTAEIVENVPSSVPSFNPKISLRGRVVDC